MQIVVSEVGDILAYPVGPKCIEYETAALRAWLTGSFESNKRRL